MWLSALYIWGCLLAFAECDSCPESEDAASWVKLKPLGNCDDEENVCPYQITLPPLSIQLPKPFRELEKMAKELQNLKEVVNRLRRDCQECKERQRVERAGTRDHVEDEGRRTQSVKQNISSGERQSHNGEKMVRIVISTPPQGDREEINHSSLESKRWSNDRRSDADQITVDQSSETSREFKIFGHSLEETPEDIYQVKQALSPSTEETDRQRKIQLGELIKSSVPRRKDTVESVTHGSEMSREIKILNPSLGETPEDISELKQVFTPTTEERERTFQEAELLESPIPRTKDFVQSPTHRKQQPNMFRERNAKNISGILAVRRRAQNMTDTNRLGSTSGDANTKTMDLSISAGNRRIVNFSRAGGPLRQKTYINSRTKASEENRLRKPAAVRMHLQGGERTVKTGPNGSGFSPVRSGVMRVKETTPHIENSNPGTNSGFIISTNDEKIATINPKPGTNIGILASNEDEKIAIRNPNLGTNSILTPLTHQKITIKNPKDGTNSGLNPSTYDDNIAIVNPNPGTNSRLTPSTDEKIMTKAKPGTISGLNTSTENENMAIINPNTGIKNGIIISTEDEKLKTTSPKPDINVQKPMTPTIINPNLVSTSELNPSTEDEHIAKVNPKPGLNSRLTSSTGNGKMTTKPKPGTNSGLTTTTEDENMAKINPKTGIKIEQISTEDERMTVTSPQPVTNSRTDEKMIILNPKFGSNSGLNPSNEDENIAIVNPKPGTNSHLTPSTDEEMTIINPKPITYSRLTLSTDEKMTTNTKPDTNSRLTTSFDDEEIAIINPNHGTKIGQIISTGDEKLTATTSKSGTSISQTPATNEKMTITNPKLGTNIRLTPSTTDGKLTNPKPGINSRSTLSTNDEKMTTTKPRINIGLTTSTEDENMGIINPNPGNKTGQIRSTEDGKLTVKSSKPGTNLSLTPSTKEKTSITNPKLGTDSRLSSSTDEGKSTTTNPKPITNSGLTPSTGGKRIMITNPKPETKSRLTPSTHVEKMANQENTSAESDLRTKSENYLKDARQVTVDGEENLRKLNKTVITRVPTNLRTEDRGDVSHTHVRTTNKSIFSVKNGVEQPNLIKEENEHMGLNASLVTSSTAEIGPSAGKADSTFPGRRVDEKNYLTPITGTNTESDQGDLGSTVLDAFNERETYPLTSDETQMGTFREEASEKKTPGSVKKDLLRNGKVPQLESDLLNPTLVPSVKITSADHKVSTASKTGQGTRILKPGSISPREDVGNIQPTNSKTNISKMREGSNVRFVKNITRVMPKLPIRPGRHPTTGNPSGGPKLHMINKMPGNSSVVLPSNYSISGRNVNFGRRNSSVMMKPSYVRSRPRFQTEPNTRISFKTNVSTVTHFITPTVEISTDREEEIKPETQAMGLHVLDKNTSSMLNSRNADEVQDHVEGHSIESVSTSKVLSGTQVSYNENSLYTGASDSLSGGKESKQFDLETTGQHPSTQQKELSGVNVKSQPATSSNPRVSFTVMDHEESTKHIPPVTIKHEDMVKNISQDTASTPISFENTVATRELELIELNEDKVPKYSGDILSNPNSVSDVRGNNGESPEDTADGFKTIAVRDEVTQKERAENKIQSTCEGDCITTPTQQPTTQGRPAFESERGRGLPQDCADYITKARKNGVYRVTPRSKNTTFYVPCDMETSGGGWTLIQQRFNGSISFNRTWDEYKRGFGKLIGEFWLGNDKIYWLTQARNMSLRIELEDFEGVREYAHYDHFQVANESQQYRLSIGGYSGTAGNAMQFNKNYNHDQKLFTTPDRDNDLYPSGNCGAYYSSGWWFDACMSANLNGIYYHTKYKGVRNGIFWGTWHNITMEYYPTNVRQSFKTVRMMIRPQSYAD
ncbi:mucin-4 isoform X2 [Triplophysa dalaica]|uniref:mucin-4 isoform X2 n=1 Tax=Triplophysa dalaica TaxID=1582913 RepID=UPI0024DFBC70|nr:mucin-4 isoform X2 [Triplophysa dalaica]